MIGNSLKNKIELWVHESTVMTFSRSGGPGGQNVNKVNTKVTARLLLTSADFLTEGQLGLLRERLATRINDEGELVISVSESRSQLQNKDIAFVRIIALITGALHVAKKRKKTRPSKASKQKRLDKKKKNSLKKQDRRSVDY